MICKYPRCEYQMNTKSDRPCKFRPACILARRIIDIPLEIYRRPTIGAVLILNNLYKLFR